MTSSQMGRINLLAIATLSPDSVTVLEPVAVYEAPPRPAQRDHFKVGTSKRHVFNIPLAARQNLSNTDKRIHRSSVASLPPQPPRPAAPPPDTPHNKIFSLTI